ncbi:ABC transporter permease subunit [Paenibacillus sp. ACRRX]|uniref:ABC transporter permease subunit n=1 Tax=unclassified Paenibacillus TaxID=185978 RepID=UPI001EF4BC19|nr:MULTISPECIES: ABC transporter permease subunit [unclassified Paenibacillus]MCG7410526.1 ABC transporter permease subunit [Paenibacillus sp. ACRRX]MDK8183951.1 ABC transporter permease subunit [Paenibacillus sp. UMB4589-SE434]
MSSRSQLLRSFVIGIVAMILIILIVLFPRQLDITVERYKVMAEYQFSWDVYWNNISEFFKGVVKDHSLGMTRHNDETAGAAVLRSMSFSLIIIVTAFTISFVLGILKGILDYQGSRRKIGFFGNWTTWLFQSIPDFLLLLLIQWLLIRYVPSLRIFALEGWTAFLLPSLLVSVYPLVYIARITSASLASQEGQLYIKVARAKGLTRVLVLYKHMLANCVGSILSHLSSLFVYILSNLLMVEYFMNYPGAALRLFLAMDYSISYGTGQNYEPGVIIGICFCFMFLLLLVQWISQMSRIYLDPRKGL